MGHPSYFHQHLISPAHQADLAATFQEAFELVVLEVVEKELESIRSARADSGGGQVDGIVVTGGCALNVKLNDRLRRTFNMQVSAPSAPADDGLSLGGVLIAHSPAYLFQPSRPVHTGYWGSLPWDIALLSDVASTLGGERASPEALADLMVRDQAVVGVVRGRSEFGPRALGHRSLLAVAAQPTIREKLNSIKKRKWWRPVAPVVTVESYFTVVQSVPIGSAAQDWYMSAAPPLTEAAVAALPGIAHFDGTARVQTVSRNEEPWLHALLCRIGERTGWAVLANTSFNRWGKPIINRIADALKAFADEPELAYLHLEDYVFSRDIFLKLLISALRTLPTDIRSVLDTSFPGGVDVA